MIATSQNVKYMTAEEVRRFTSGWAPLDWQLFPNFEPFDIPEDIGELYAKFESLEREAKDAFQASCFAYQESQKLRGENYFLSFVCLATAVENMAEFWDRGGAILKDHKPFKCPKCSREIQIRCGRSRKLFINFIRKHSPHAYKYSNTDLDKLYGRRSKIVHVDVAAKRKAITMVPSLDYSKTMNFVKDWMRLEELTSSALTEFLSSYRLTECS